MRPELFHIPLPEWMPIGDLPIRGYGTMLALGFLTAILVAAWRARREGENPDHIYNAAILSLLGGVIGARLFDVIEYSASYPGWTRGFNVVEGVSWFWLILGGAAAAALALTAVVPWSRDAEGRVRRGAVIGWAVVGALILGRGAYVAARQDEYYGFIAALKVTSGGLTVYGGLILATALVVPYLLWLQHRRGVNPLKLLDIIAPSLALGLAFGRTGCFLNGCCYGAPCDHLPWAFAWPEGSIPWQAWGDAPLHPAQLYGILNGLLLFLLLHMAYRHKKRHGVIIGAFFGLYAVSRILLEMVRSDEPKDYLGGLSVSQAVGVFAIVGVAAYFLWLRTTKLSRLDWQSPVAQSAADASTAPPTNHRRKRNKKK